jgi:hypothetical protein
MKCHGKIPLNNEYTLKNEGQEYKTGNVLGSVLVGGGKEMERRKGELWWVYLTYLCENRKKNRDLK